MIELTMQAHGELIYGYTGDHHAEDTLGTELRGGADLKGEEGSTQEGEGTPQAQEAPCSQVQPIGIHFVGDDMFSDPNFDNPLASEVVVLSDMNAHELEKLRHNQEFVVKHGIGDKIPDRSCGPGGDGAPPVDPIDRAARNVAWVHDVIQLLIDHPRLLENRDYLIGTLRSLVHSLDPESNPTMTPLKVEGKRRL